MRYGILVAVIRIAAPPAHDPAREFKTIVWIIAIEFFKCNVQIDILITDCCQVINLVLIALDAKTFVRIAANDMMDKGANARWIAVESGFDITSFLPKCCALL